MRSTFRSSSRAPNAHKYWLFQVKVAILKYIESLARQMDPTDFINSSETRLAVSRIITWTTEPKSSDVRKVRARELFFCGRRRAVQKLEALLPQAHAELVTCSVKTRTLFCPLPSPALLVPARRPERKSAVCAVGAYFSLASPSRGLSHEQSVPVRRLIFLVST